jgi:hypothetical protein
VLRDFVKTPQKIFTEHGTPNLAVGSTQQPARQNRGRNYNAGVAITRHCWKCGVEYTLAGTPGRSETCICGADLKVCLNCVSYDPRVAHQCRDRRAEPVADKQMANFCEYFEMARREFVPKAENNSRETKARDAFKKLFGD